MVVLDREKVYEYKSADGQNWKYQFSDEIVRNQDRVCIGYAKVWKKDDDPSKYYTVLISSANADEVMCHMEVGKGIEFHIAMA